MTVKATLDDLLVRSNATGADQVLFQYFHKLALIELCGWIEVEQDQMVNSCATYLGVNNAPKSYLGEKIKRNYGFTYDEHFRGLLSLVCGLGVVEKVEKAIDAQVFESFKATLESLKTKRNSLTHTHLGVTSATDSPTVCLANYQIVENGLKALAAQLRALQQLPPNP
jgi:hypothetical protein